MLRNLICSTLLALAAIRCEAQQPAPEAEMNAQIEAANGHLRIGVALHGRGLYQEAITETEKALAIFAIARGPEHPDTAVTINNLAALHEALGQYERALPLYRRSLAIQEQSLGPEHPSVATTMNNLAGLYRSTGQLERALPLFKRALAIRENVHGPEHTNVGIALNNLAALLESMGQFEGALQHYQRSLSILEKTLGPKHPTVATLLNNLGALHEASGRYELALSLHQRSLAISELADGADHPNVAISLNNLAGLHNSLGKYEHALPLFQRSLSILERSLGPEHPTVATALNNIAVLLQSMGQKERAIELHRRALAVRESFLGPMHADVAVSLNNLAEVLHSLGQYEAALPHFERSLAILEQSLGSDHPSIATSLNNLARLHLKIGDPKEAGRLLLRAVSIVSPERDPETAWRIWSGLRTLKGKGDPSAAIFFGKQAVNGIQSLRRRVSLLGLEFGRSYLDTVRQEFHALADLMVEQGRLPEAQRVLAMLKEEELFEFVRRDVNEDPRSTRAGYTVAEAPWFRRYGEIAARVAALGDERRKLELRRKSGLSTEEEARLRQLDADGEIARRALVAFMDDLTAEMRMHDGQRRAEVARRNVEGLENHQDDLRAAGDGAVMLHYVALPERLRIIVTTPDAQAGRAVEVTERVLNQRIQAFRQALQNPALDPRPLGKELYDLLIAPVAVDLAQAKAKTLVVSLDGALRYVPIAALHDGMRFVVEKYRVAILTDAAKGRLSAKPERGARFAGLGLTRRIEGFEPLPAVRAELEGILRDGNVIGEAHLDDAFTVQQMRTALSQGVQLLHVASHFKFNPGTEVDSFLVLGDGSRFSLRDLREAGFNFRGVELLTLSACETAIGGGTDANGREVEGFGALAQQRGAKAVMATLWPVADTSTGMLMQQFYLLRADSAGMSKAEALRQAQLQLLFGKHAPQAHSPQRGIQAIGRSFTTDLNAPFAHPYYWAPFILMGNWL